MGMGPPINVTNVWGGEVTNLLTVNLLRALPSLCNLVVVSSQPRKAYV